MYEDIVCGLTPHHAIAQSWAFFHNRVASMTVLQEEFNAYHKRSPQIYQKLKTLALRLKRVGASTYGMKALFEILRFNALLQSDKKFKLQNNHAPYYARLLMQQEPQLAGFFYTRELTSTRKY